MAEPRNLAVSLFSGAGIGDVGYRATGFDFVSMCELEPERAALAWLNFPSSRVFCADVKASHNAIVSHARSCHSGAELHLLTCTAPCQGMSKNGQGTLLKNIRAGNRPALDPRNRLILPALEVIRSLRPRWVVFENVIEMRNTLIEDHDQKMKYILDIVFDRLSDEYAGCAYDVEFADYGIPQRRQRLITVLTRDKDAISAFRAGEQLIPPPTHAKMPTPTLARWVSVMDAIGDFPPLDGRDEASAQDLKVPFHRVPVLDPKKYEWIRRTPPGKSAFDNQCVQPSCGFQGNTSHGASHDGEGINRAHRDTPLYCERCGALLPRPYTEVAGGIRLMSGYTSAYKRMDPSLPAPALTRNLSYPCSDQKLHPFQNRVLSLAEAMRLHTLDRYDFRWVDLPKDRGVGQKGVDSRGGGHRWPARPTRASSSSRPSACSPPTASPSP
ncbi:MAG: DNA cytosine methyltransferase, partial [Gemmataceae bacterium]|nr:DNA cytosine methyltransferase [Gemmataceae bacterium]